MKNPNNPNGLGPQDYMRMLVAMALTFIILVIFNKYFMPPPKQQTVVEQAASVSVPAVEQPFAPRLRGDLIAESLDDRVLIETDKVKGSISLKGGRIDDVSLAQYKTALDNPQDVALFSPSGSNLAFYAEFGWAGNNMGNNALPSANTKWSLASDSAPRLTVETPVKLVWDNGQGMTFERDIAIDEHYMFTITQRIINNSDKSVTLHPYQLLSRHGIPSDVVDFFVLHEGLIGYLAEEMQEIDYNDLRKDGTEDFKTRGGWTGFVDKYWFAGLIPHQDRRFTANYVHSEKTLQGPEKFQADLLGDAVQIQKGVTVENKFNLFAGAKELAVVDLYQEEMEIKNFDLVFDYGIWFIITKPFMHVLTFLTGIFGHVGWAILAFTVLVRLALYPLNNKSFRSMAGMRKVGPKLQEIQAKYKDDRVKMQEQIFALYQKEGVNPFSGCWPILLQIPIMFALYKVIMMDIDMRHAPFWGWIDDMSVQDPTSLFNLFGLLPYNVPEFLLIGAWPCLMGVTMILQRRMQPPVTDKTSAMIANTMPYFFAFIMAKFAAGLVIYWTWSNLLGIIQQYVIMRRMGVEVSLISGHGDRKKTKEAKEEVIAPENKDEKSMIDEDAVIVDAKAETIDEKKPSKSKKKKKKSDK